MLRLTRKVGQAICLLDEKGEVLFTVSVENMGQKQVSLGIKNDVSKTSVKRAEIMEAKSEDHG